MKNATSFANPASSPSARRLLRRLGHSSLFALMELFSPIFNFLLSLLVVRLVSLQLWGEFVYVLIALHVAGQVLSWGHKSQVLREISRRPARLPVIWWRNLATRALLLVPVTGGVLLLPIAADIRAGMLVWLAAQFIYKSFDVLVQFRRLYGVALGLEAGAAALLLSFAAASSSALTLPRLVAAFAAMQLLKAVLLALVLHRDVPLAAAAKPQLALLRTGLPFFLTGFISQLQAKTDLFCVAALLPAVEVGRYQILISLLWNLQSLAIFIVVPILPQLYRMPWQRIDRLSRRLFGLAVVAGIPGIVAVALLLRLYRLPPFDLPAFVLGYVFVLPFFCALPKIHYLFAGHRQGIVAFTMLSAAGANACLNLVLIPVFELEGALLATAIVQWGMLLVFELVGRRLFHKIRHPESVETLPSEADIPASLRQ